MGVGISNWKLARAVAKLGQLGVVSGTAMDAILARRLQDGDVGGHMQRALSAFPFQETAQRILQTYFRANGRPEGTPYASTPMPSNAPVDGHLDLIIAGSFVEVFLAKQGHNGLVGVNLLEKIQAPKMPSL
jgi:nitronate monooxygenase